MSWKARDVRITLILVAALLILSLGLFQNTAAAEEGPRYGGTLITVNDQPVLTLNPLLREGVIEQRIGSKIFSGLVAWDSNFQPVPELAKSWDIVNDGKRFIFYLRDDVTWHDGEPFSSADVFYTFENVLTVYRPVTVDFFDVMLDSFEAPDPYTFIINLKAPSATLLNLLTVRDAAILPSHLYEGTDIMENPYNLNPVGTGPFQFNRRIAGSEVVLVRNENYFKEGRPFLDGIIILERPDPVIGGLAFLSGFAHYLPSVYAPRDTITRALGDPQNVAFESENPPSVVSMHFNTIDNEYLRDARVRQAISMAIDREEIINLGQGGLGVPMGSFIPYQYGWAVNPNVEQYYSYNPERAEQLLDEAGFHKDSAGKRFSLNLIVTAGNINVLRPSEIIRSQLGRVGIEIEVIVLDRAIFLDRVYGNYDFDLKIHNYASLGDPVLGIPRNFVSSAISPEGRFNNVSRYSNPVVDELFDQVAIEVDREKRREIFFELQEIIAADMPVSALFTRSDTGVFHEDYIGLNWRPARTSWDWVWYREGETVAEGFEPLEPDLMRFLQD